MFQRAAGWVCVESPDREVTLQGHTAGQNYGGDEGSVTGARWGGGGAVLGFRWTRVRAGGLTDVGKREAEGTGVLFFLWVCDGAQILRALIVSALLLSRSPASCRERR